MEQDKKALFQITEAAHACGLSRSTLLRMEEKGLLAPAYIAPDSGRRYYDNHNVARIMQIEKLKAMGLGTEEIAGYFASGGEVTDLLSMLEERLRDERQQRGRIIPGDFALANMTRTLTSVSAKGAGEQGAAQAGGKRYEDYLDQLAGDEW